MTKSRTTPPQGRCATCGETHHETSDGFYADNGHGRHAYAPPDPTPPRLAIVGTPAVTVGTIPAGIEPTDFQAFWRCLGCRALLERGDPHVHTHLDTCPGNPGGNAA